jgi:putative oxidoreductase
VRIASKLAKFILGLFFVLYGLYTLKTMMPFLMKAEIDAYDRSLISSSRIYLFALLLEVAGGFMILSGRLTPMGLVIVTPVLINALFFNRALDTNAVPLLLILCAIDIFLIWRHKKAFAPLVTIRKDQCTFTGKND